MNLISSIVTWFYRLIQMIMAWVFSPHPPERHHRLPGPRIAVIGAGITGVSSAAHCIGHGFEVQIFEAGDQNHLGGIWSQTNSTSSLQIHSVMYRFHPSVRFRKAYPDRQGILRELTQLWKKYDLDERTTFGVSVEKIWRDEKSGKWIVQDPSYGTFDGIIAAVGTCGDPKMPHISGQESYSGTICHSSKLTDQNLKGKSVIVIGGGASALEAVSDAVREGAGKIVILSRSTKWIIPRNPIIDGILALNPFGEETTFSWIPEFLLRMFFYRDLEDLTPNKAGLYTETPMVNDEVLREVRAGRVSWLRGDIKGFREHGILFNHREKGVPKGGAGREEIIHGDLCVMATGFHRPSLGFLPDDCFKSPYSPPNWFLQTFPVGHPDISATNATYVSAIGTVGNIHIGLYTRMLLMFIADPSTKPSTPWMRLWVDWTRLWKWKAPGGALEFFTYSELILWVIVSVALSPRRWKWAPFVLFGWGRIRSVKELSDPASSLFHSVKVAASRDIDTSRSYQGQGENKDSRDGKEIGTTGAEGHEGNDLPTYAAALSSHQSNAKLQNKPPSKGTGSSLAKLASERAESLDENGKVTTIPSDKAIGPGGTTMA